MPNITWEQTIPNNYNPATQRVQWMNLVPDMPSINDGIYVTGRGEDSIEYLLSKGVTHVGRGELTGYSLEKQMEFINGGHSIDAPPPQTHTQLGRPDRGAGNSVWTGPPGKPLQWPEMWNRRFFNTPEGATEPMSYEEGYQAGLNYPITHNIIIFENSEQDHALGTQWNLWRGFYAALMPRMAQRWGSLGIRYYVGHNYFTGISGVGASLRNSSRSQAKEFYAKPTTQWQSDMLNGGTLALTNTMAFPIYLGAPDVTAGLQYEQIWAAAIAHKANKYSLTYLQTFREDKPNNLMKVNTQGYDFYMGCKLPLGTSIVSAFAVISRIFGDGLAIFLPQGRETTPFRLLREYHAHDSIYIPNGQTNPGNVNSAPILQDTGPEIFPANGVEDSIAFGMKDYFKTFKQTRGGERKFLKYRINEGQWVNPINNNWDDLVDAQNDRRRIAYGELLGNKLSIFTINPYGNHESQKIDIMHPTLDIMYTGYVSSNNHSVTLINTNVT